MPQNKKEIERKKVSKDLTKVYFLKRKKIGNGKVFYLAGYLQQFEEKLFCFFLLNFKSEICSALTGGSKNKQELEK